MARRFLGTLPIALGLLVAACADQNDSSPTAPASSFKETTGCDFTVFSSLTAQYFTTNARRQRATDYVTSMQSAAAGTAARIDAGFNLLDEIAETVDSTYRGIGTSGPAATGSSLAQATIRCQYSGLGELPDFTVSLDPTSKGAFKVKGAPDASPVRARTDVGSEPISVVAPAAGNNWSDIVKAADGTTATRALIYGRPVLTSGASPVVDPLRYQWEAIHPDIVFAGDGAIVAICAADGDSDWIQESNLGILAYQSAGSLCTTRTSQAVSFLDGGWRPALLAKRLVEFMSPEPLSAAVAARSTGGTAGGLKSIFSQKPVTNAALKFVAPLPSSTPKVNKPITVVVEAKSADQVLMNGVKVTLVGTNNNGTFTMLVQSDGTSCLSSSPAPSGLTGSNGTGSVKITFCVTKTGGLILRGKGNSGGPSTVFTDAGPLKLNIKP